MADQGYLDGGLVNVEGGQWKSRLGRLAGNLLSEWDVKASDLDTSDIRAACKLLKLCTKLDRSAGDFLPALTRFLSSIRAQLCSFSEAEAKAEYATAAYSRGYLLSCGLKTLSELVNAGVQGGDTAAKEVIGDVNVLMRAWSWSRGIMSGVGRLAETALPKKSPLETIVSSISGRLQSDDPEIRTGALRILVTGKFPALRTLDGQPADPEEINVFQHGLQVEDAGMSLHNVRERTTKIRKIGLVLRGLDVPDEEYAWLIEAIIRYLFSKRTKNPASRRIC